MLSFSSWYKPGDFSNFIYNLCDVIYFFFVFFDDTILVFRILFPHISLEFDGLSKISLNQISGKFGNLSESKFRIGYFYIVVIDCTY